MRQEEMEGSYKKRSRLLQHSYFINQLQCTLLYSITICLLHYYPRHVSGINMPIFRRKNCFHTASGIFALNNVCTVHRLRANSCSVCFVVPDCCVVPIQFHFCVLILVNRLCLFCIMQFVYCADVYRERRYQMLCEYNLSS
jgi:hypothetical protein